MPDFSAGGAGGRAGIDVLDYEIDARNNLIYGVFNDVDVRSESRYDELTTTFDQITLDLAHQLTDTLSLNALIGRAKSEHDNPVQTTLLFDRVDTDGFTYDYRQDDRLPLMTYGFDVASPANYTLTQIRLRPQTSDNTFDNAEVDLVWDATDRLSFKAGVSVKNLSSRPPSCAAPTAPRRTKRAMSWRRPARRLRTTAGSQASRTHGICRQARSRLG